MTFTYSKTTNSFYPQECRYLYEQAGTWPGDGIEISEEQYGKLLDGLSQGKVLTASEEGFPVLSDPLPLTADEMEAEAESRKSSLLAAAGNTISWLQDAADLGMATDDEKAALTAWKTYRVLLSRVDPASAPDIDWPEAPDDVGT